MFTMSKLNIMNEGKLRVKWPLQLQIMFTAPPNSTRVPHLSLAVIKTCMGNNFDTSYSFAFCLLLQYRNLCSELRSRSTIGANFVATDYDGYKH